MAWCLDGAVVTFGKVIEGKLSEVHPKTQKRKHNLKQLLAPTPKPGEKREPRKITTGELFAMGLPVQIPVEK